MCVEQEFSQNPVSLSLSPSPLQCIPLPSPLQADYGNHLIRCISLPSGVVSTLAGNGFSGSTNGVATNARFNNSVGIALDAAGTFAVVVS